MAAAVGCGKDALEPNGRVTVAPPNASLTVIPAATFGQLGTNGGYVSDINELHQIVGYTIDLNRQAHATVWRDVFGPIELPSLGGQSWATRSNATGVITGHAETAAGMRHAVVWTNGVLRDLNDATASGSQSLADGINSRGDVAGSVIDASGQQRAAVWRDGQVIDLGLLGGRWSRAIAINDAGVVAGAAELASGEVVPFTWQGGVMTQLPSEDGAIATVAEINNHGEIVGTMSGNGRTHAVLWRDGAMVDLGDLGGGTSVGLGINDAGQVVGQSTNADNVTRAFVWEDGVMTDLDGDIMRSFSIATAVDNAGVVAGFQSGPQGVRYVVVWTLVGQNKPPVAFMNGPYAADEGSAIAFDASASSDPDGTVLTYEWTFGDGATSTKRAPAHPYADEGSYVVTLRVTDADGAATTTTSSASVRNVAPSVTSSAGTELFSGGTFDLGGSFSDPGVNDNPWTWTVSWGDGRTGGGRAETQGAVAASARYLAAGRYTVRFRVTDVDGDAGEAMTTVVVKRIPVAIDIKPGSSDNPVKLNDASDTQLTVAVLSTASFDATTVDASSVSLASVNVSVKKNGSIFASAEDVNGDGRRDLVLHFARSDLVTNGDLTVGTTGLTLFGALFDGRQVSGSDVVRPIQ